MVADPGAYAADPGAQVADPGAQRVQDSGDDAGPGQVARKGVEDMLTAGEDISARASLGWCLRARRKYMAPPPSAGSDCPQPSPRLINFIMLDGIANVPFLEVPDIPSHEDFKRDLIQLWKIVKAPSIKTLAMSRLRRLRMLFKSYALEHAGTENAELRRLNIDIYSVMKVDNHIHLAAAMTPRLLLAFIKEKFRSECDREVAPGRTLRDIFREALKDVPRPEQVPRSPDGGLSYEEVTKMIHVDSLRTCAGEHFYHRFDRFNDAYNPLGSDALRTLFLKSSNYLQGQYFGELAQRTIASYEENDTYSELRISIYGKDAREWDNLARWLKANELCSAAALRRNLWIVQIPRVFGVFCRAGLVKSFDELLTNIFQPLFEVALNPSSHPELAEVLPWIVGFDSVDDESLPDPLTARRSTLYGDSAIPTHVDDPTVPQLWTVAENPPYSYYCYYLHANIRRFNDVARILGRPWKLAFRPHAGETGEVHHLATTFLLADGINHGINLWHSPVLQYLYYLAQVGISVSPISNNALFLRMSDNPFPYLFWRGLNVTLSTDDPLMFHATTEPLLEEYTAARLLWGLSHVDLSEIAANSVRQSAFPAAVKAQALGREGCAAPYNWDPACCNVPERRLRHRRRCLADEFAFLLHGAPPLLEPPEAQADYDWARVPLP